MSIAAKVQQCFGQFRSLQQYDADIVETGSKYRIEDESSRFKIWCGNLSAHRPSGGRSLEHRLRDSSNLKAQVMKLLDDLLETLNQQSIQRALPDDKVEETSSDVDEDDSLDFEFDDMAIQPKHPWQKVHEIVNLLYHFSIALRHPTGHDRILAGVSSISNYSLPFDLDRVRSKYPQANEVLQDRLGRAMSTRRQYLKYREEHHAKLAAGLEKNDDTQSTLATSVHEVKVSKDLNIADEVESVYSMTSFALTESDSSKLRPPALPESGERGDPFECPLCYSVQQFTSKKLWNQHVYEDLQPYCCTINECSSKHELYSRRRDWQRHQTQSHNSVWVCPFSCSAVHTTPAALETHLATAHGQIPNKNSLQKILDASARPVEAKGKQSCPLCDKVLDTVNLWFKHVGRHMEQLALSSLPSHLLASESEEELEEAEVEAHNSLSEPGGRNVQSSLRALSASDEGDKLVDDIVHELTGLSISQGITSDDRSSNSESEDVAPRDSLRPDQLPQTPVDVQKPPILSSYWSKTDLADFEKYVAICGTDFEAISGYMGTKTPIMIKNHYQRQIDGGRTDLLILAAQANLLQGGDPVNHENNPPTSTKATLGEYFPRRYVKTGCLTCRKRRIKCGEERPICKNCVKSKRFCEGYVQPFEFIAQPSYKHNRELSETGSHFTENNNEDNDRSQLEKASERNQLHGRDILLENDPGLKVLFGPAIEKVNLEENIQKAARETSYSPEFYGRVDRQVKEAESEGNLDDRTRNMFSAHTKAWDHISQSRSHTRTQVETDQHQVLSHSSSNEDIPITVRRSSTTTGIDEKEEQKLQAEMRRRLQSMGYTDKTIDILMDEEKARQSQEDLRNTEEQIQTRAPVYPKIHRDYLAIETLDHYELPWEYDRKNPDYIIITREMDKHQTDILFEHTDRFRSGQLFVDSSKRKGKEFAFQSIQ